MTDLSAQLPALVRGIFYEGWQPGHTPVADRTKAAFVARVQADFGQGRLNDPDAATAAVFALLDRKISAGEIDQVRQSMKKQLQQLWPDAK